MSLFTKYLGILIKTIWTSRKLLLRLLQVSLLRLYLHAECRTASKDCLIVFQLQVQKRVI